MPKYEVSLRRWVSARQIAKVFVEADDADHAEELAWQGDIDWKTVKTLDFGDQDAAVDELPE